MPDDDGWYETVVATECMVVEVSQLAAAVMMLIKVGSVQGLYQRPHEAPKRAAYGHDALNGPYAGTFYGLCRRPMSWVHAVLHNGLY